MIRTGSELPISMKRDAQAVVIGSGAGGAVVTKELAEGGIDVVMLEAGGYNTAKDFTQREEDMFPKIYADSGARTSADASVLIMQGQTLGGSTVHNICLSFRPERAIIERWQNEAKITFGYDDFLPYLKRVERHVGVNKIKEEEININNALFRQGCEAIGIESKTPYHNRINCLRCGYCDLACAYDRKQSTLITYVPKADAASADIYTDCRVVNIRVLEEGKLYEIVGNVLDSETRKIRGSRGNFSASAGNRLKRAYSVLSSLPKINSRTSRD